MQGDKQSGVDEERRRREYFKYAPARLPVSHWKQWRRRRRVRSEQVVNNIFVQRMEKKRRRLNEAHAHTMNIYIWMKRIYEHIYSI